MKTLMTTTALVVATALPVTAQSKSGDGAFMAYEEGDVTAAEMLASNLIGKRIYASETKFTGDRASGVTPGWQDIGEVSDVVMSRGGETESILLDIGGFLGIGENTVAVSFDELQFVPIAGLEGEFFVVFTSSRDMMEEVEPFNFDQIGAWTSAQWSDATQVTSDAMDNLQSSVSDTADAVEKSAENTVEQTAEAVGDATQELEQAADAAGSAVADAADEITGTVINRSGYETLPVSALTSDTLTGAAVYDVNEKWIGEVSELVLDDSGQVQHAVIDVGGFLGIGEKPVAKELGSLTMQRAMDGSDLRVYVDTSKRELKQMPAYSGS